MSRVGKSPIAIADGVTVTIAGHDIKVKGKKGELSLTMSSDVTIEQKDKQIILAPANDSQEARARWGLYRNLINNMVTGVSEGFTVKLEIQGVGYRAQAQGKTLKLNMGFSHDVDYPVPAGIEIKTPKPTEIEISGANKQLVGQVAAEIRQYRKPEPYKGKGIRYEGEYVRRKEGKKK